MKEETKFIALGYMCLNIAKQQFKKVNRNLFKQEDKQALKRIESGFKGLLMQANRDAPKSIEIASRGLSELLNIGIDIINNTDYEFQEILDDLKLTYLNNDND